MNKKTSVYHQRLKCTIWLFNIAMEAMAHFLDGLPSYKMVDLSMAMLNNQMGILYCFVIHEASPFEHHQPFGSNIVDRYLKARKKKSCRKMISYNTLERSSFCRGLNMDRT